MAAARRNQILERIHSATKSPTKRFAELVNMPNDEWAAELERITGKPKEKLLEALAWGMKTLGESVTETELKALTIIAADEKGAIS